MAEFRVIDLRTKTVAPEALVQAQSPEGAAESALGVKAVRSGKPQHLICRVYWETNGTTNMVRLYSESAYSQS